MRDACLLLFTKPARPGRVKTRLIANPEAPELGGLTPEQAARLHLAFLEDVASRLSVGAFDLTLAWALEPDDGPPPSSLAAIRQEGADLGERLWRALAVALETHRLAAAVGADHPELPLEVVEGGFERLRSGAEVVLGPAVDGGYYFIGVSEGGLEREIFEGIEWSTAGVLEATLERCRARSLRVELLERGSDVDTPADLEGLIRRLAAARRRGSELAVSCPRTERLLRDWGLLESGEPESPRALDPQPPGATA